MALCPLEKEPETENLVYLSFYLSGDLSCRSALILGFHSNLGASKNGHTGFNISQYTIALTYSVSTPPYFRMNPRAR